MPTPAASFDGGDLDCGNGLLLLIRKHIDPLPVGAVLEIRSTESSVEEDLPAWCRLTQNALIGQHKEGRQTRYLVAKGQKVVAPVVPAEVGKRPRGEREAAPLPRPVVTPVRQVALPEAASAPAIAPLSAMGIGSWPRPRWMLDAIAAHLETRLPEARFQETADDAVRLVVDAQLRAGVDVVTDGEQRRDNYASFVGARLQNCQLVPITDLLPYVDDPDTFARELAALDVPASSVRHPAVFGPLGRELPLAAHELAFVRTLTELPVKVALPGPYLLTRTMWMECISDRAYRSREELSVDLVRVLREEIAALLAGGAALVQLDEPVLSEVVFGAAREGGGRTFMCGALGDKKPVAEELAFAESLLVAVTAGFPRERLALHVCRGNWSPDESVALTGSYAPLLETLARAPVGTLFLEACTPRAGDLALLSALPRDKRIGVGVVDQKSPRVESLDEVLARAERAIALLGADRVLLVPDCGFATFADNPITSTEIARQKLGRLVSASRALRGG